MAGPAPRLERRNVFAIAAPWHVLAEGRSPGFAWAYLSTSTSIGLSGRGSPTITAPFLSGCGGRTPRLAFSMECVRPLLLRSSRGPGPGDWPWMPVPRPAFFCSVGRRDFRVLLGRERLAHGVLILGAWPALALLLGLSIAHAEEGGGRTLRWIMRGLATLGVVYAAAVGMFLRLTAHAPQATDMTADLHSRGAEPTNRRWLACSTSRPRPCRPAHASPRVGGVARRGPDRRVRVPRDRARNRVADRDGHRHGGAFGASNLAYRGLEPSLSSRALALEINRTLRPDDRLVLYGDLRVAPGVAFYCNRHVLLYNERRAIWSTGPGTPTLRRYSSPTATSPGFGPGRTGAPGRPGRKEEGGPEEAAAGLRARPGRARR